MSETTEIPVAVARGPEAATSTAIRASRVAAVVGALAALFVLVTFLVAPVPGRALSIVDADGSEVGRSGGLRVIWVPPSGADIAVIEETLERRQAGARISRDRDALVVDVPGVAPAQVEDTARLLTGGGVAFHRCVIVPAMQDLASQHGFSLDGEHPPGAVHLDIDHWRPEDGGPAMTDYYLAGPSPEAIEAALAGARARGWQLPAGTHLAYEHVSSWEGRPAFWRTYVIETTPALGGDRIAEASGSYDPNTNRPVILLDFDRRGAQMFGDLTATMIGQKLATVAGGRVMSAPIINGAIRGGRASITMGGSDLATQERERDALVSVLRAGQLPDGGTLVSTAFVAPTVTDTQEWLARLVLALGAGLALGFFAWTLVRVTHPVWRVPEVRLPGGLAWGRLAVTLVAPVAVIAASRVTAPGIDVERVTETLGDTSRVGLGMLGIAPILTSALLVELAATIVPRWRRRRHAGPGARVPFDVATLLLAVVLSCVQAWFVAVYLEPLDASPLGLDRLLLVASIAAVTLGFAVVAWIIRCWGAGNGYLALLVAGVAWSVIQILAADHGPSPFLAPLPPRGELWLELFAIAVIAVVVGALLRMRIARAGELALRVPASGIAPLGEAQGVIAMTMAALGTLPLGALAQKAFDVQSWLHDLGRLASLALVALFSLLWSWAFARPEAVRSFAERAQIAPTSREGWRAATLLSAGALVAIAAGHALISRSIAAGFVGTMAATLVGAFVLDVYDDVRGRRGVLANVWSLHSAQHADLCAHVLEREGIAFHLAGANVRTLLAWFGPFAPIDVWVRHADAPRARELLANVFAPK